MAVSYLAYVGKKPTLRTQKDVYQATIYIVDDTPQNSNELQGPVSSGTAITLPDSQTYTGQELQVRLNGLDLIEGDDYNHIGSGSGKTQIDLTFTLEGTRNDPDKIDFYINRELDTTT